ncbi:hypothetical protein GCM10007276_12170 [Agaricicola taiwanensis]|uniref:Uncharacterized protein n=1 Tax=Agaricicola taiwanensis TaxID=591372 RepID=A0A8J2VP84_9RHOB|nr:hypothetical protein GCM10007276_12170 [Agaricicola taiwanensis]
MTARMRHHGVDWDKARDPLLGTFVGRLAQLGVIGGGISMEQYRAAQLYLETLDAWHRATGAPQNFNQPRPEGEGNGDWEAFVRSAKQQYAAMREALADLQVTGRTPAPIAALDVLVVRNVEHWPLVGDLRIALNALKRHFIDGQKKAA